MARDVSFFRHSEHHSRAGRLGSSGNYPCMVMPDNMPTHPDDPWGTS